MVTSVSPSPEKLPHSWAPRPPSPQQAGVRPPGEHRADPSLGTPRAQPPQGKVLFILLVSAALLSQWEGKVLSQLLCPGTLFLATRSLCSSSSPLCCGTLASLPFSLPCISSTSPLPPLL